MYDNPALDYPKIKKYKLNRLKQVKGKIKNCNLAYDCIYIDGKFSGVVADYFDTIFEKGGLSMEITEKASNLSGGQKQRLALARALLHDSDIYIFDEATSNVDVESENKIMEVIRELAHKKTVILISHRLANVVDADQILVMKDGVIEEAGTHDELMERKGYYSSLYETQQELERYAKEAV